MRNLIKNIKKNSQKLLDLTSRDKENIIFEIALNLRKNFKNVLKANEKDMANFKKTGAIRDRLLLNEKRLTSLCDALEKIALQEDPINNIQRGWKNYAGLSIQKISIPIGLICVIYEARPALSAEIIALMIKSSNACILKGGSEAKNTNLALFNIVCEVLEKYALKDCFLMLYDKGEIKELLAFDDLIDVIIPRGSEEMIKNIAQNTKIPLIKQDKGLCHIFVDESANLKNAVDIIINSKCQKPSACNALESLLIHENINLEFFDLLKKAFKKHNIKIHAHKNIIKHFENANLELFLATQKDFATEWLDFELSIKSVKNLGEAIRHINEFSSSHSDCILSNDVQNIAKFQRLINSACVYANASTRFSDGGEFGFGGEVGISTSRLHARGPMGVDEICIYKYIIYGDGQIRQ
ncbi:MULTISPECIES: glutamate-5-semialdehyde dehydrogenase [unclassified Campylobacter]|uniref:glutamate-5-semialdehyde dehydrogenase n=1 Tax=unclassified Campylobacter TaxID=2593542 RepID=UPI001237C1E8|nr:MULTISPECIES: glutamate-5-semialdehyde dehydrogenase [unclassified Campylobacter]KAA6224703.1 glutamate-5-semialdehyde dehydrogenase [Campylobacter sp. LR185c]KAA6225701.1 glutamate-5-semialdehyde dehydrogenase [Campylobacter sp. LR286c]KAA6225821.1 glutamate-5-semialdehyde dehydrogenase [Campylobacter sp. LR196d]KAA6229674.1 glutamate-5-semialdehyde dehydrogenase [Campylobacter sp. LR291e]KAA6230080.1 glutamate-5-semialdehyde dehydrogenase [Campylobacter sp. LR264d]